MQDAWHLLKQFQICAIAMRAGLHFFDLFFFQCAWARKLTTEISVYVKVNFIMNLRKPDANIIIAKRPPSDTECNNFNSRIYGDWYGWL